MFGALALTTDHGLHAKNIERLRSIRAQHFIPAVFVFLDCGGDGPISVPSLEEKVDVIAAGRPSYRGRDLGRLLTVADIDFLLDQGKPQRSSEMRKTPRVLP